MKDKKNVFLVLYYLVLLLIIVSRTNADSEPPMVFRLAFLFAVILPCIVNKTVSYPAIITIFMSIGHFGFAYSYMPYMINIYGLLTLLMTAIMVKPHQNFGGNPPHSLVLFTLYVFIIDLITGLGNPNAQFPEDVDWCFFILVCFFYITFGNEEKARKQLPTAFAVITVVLSLTFLLFRNNFSREYGQMSGLVRSGWADPNYFGMVVGMGVVMGLYKMLSNEWKFLSFAEKNLYRAAILLSLPTLALLASRGAILSLIVAVIILVLYSKAKTGYKFALFFVGIVAIVWLYQNQYFELLEYRIANEDGTGSERTVIWANKLQLYTEGNPFQWLFGYGFAGGFFIGGRGQGFHNEFIAILVDYGIVGLCSFVSLLFYPYKLLARRAYNRPLVVALLWYLVTCCFTLEPLTHALLMFFTLYFYIVLVAKEKTTVNIKNA